MEYAAVSLIRGGVQQIPKPSSRIILTNSIVSSKKKSSFDLVGLHPLHESLHNVNINDVDFRSNILYHETNIW